MKLKLKTKKWLTIVFGCSFIFTACTTEFVDLNETCTVTGNIITRDEFGIEIEDASRVTVSLDKTNFSSLTNENGVFIFENLPIGSYDFILGKDGYGTRIIHSVDIFSLQDTFDLRQFDLIQRSSIKIQNFRIEQEGYQLYACGTITHNFPYTLKDGEYTPFTRVLKSPSIAIYFNDQDNVSVTNYIRNFSYDVFSPSGTDFRTPLNWVISTPLIQEQTYYYVAYGESLIKGYENTVYDPETGFNKYYPTLLGEPSNIFSITKNQ